MKISHCFFATCLFAVCFTAAATSDEAEKNGALSKCAILLPDGYKYSIKIDAVLDKKENSANKNLQGELLISDDTNKELDPAKNKQVKPFVKCVIDTVL